MPYPARIDRDTIVATAADLIAQHGVEWLSLAKIARVLGVRAPSLYRHVGSRAELLRAVNLQTNAALTAALRAAAEQPTGDPHDRLMQMARAYRAFAHDHPAIYGLAFTNTLSDLRPDEDALEQLALPLQAQMAAISGEADSLPALRGLWALLHGYVMLELSAQMRRGGDLAATFDRVVAAYLCGWQG
jgi:AcrR family transcriptional regulator